MKSSVYTKTIFFLGLAGIIFAGYFTIPEIQKLLSGAQTGYSLGLPTCAYGLIFYIIIFILSIRHLKNSGNTIG